MERFVGKVQAAPGSLVFADATLAVGDKKYVERREGPGHFTLALEDGRTLEVRGVVPATRSGKLELEGRWGELVEHPVTRMFEARAPGDHVRVQIRGFALTAGDLVTVEGEVTEQRLVEHEPGRGDVGLREAPRREPSVVVAKRLHLGRMSESDSRRRSGPVPPEPRARAPLQRSTAIYLTLGLGLFVPALVASWIAPIVPLRALLTPALGLGLALSLVGLHRLVLGRLHASYVTIVGGARVTPWEPIRAYYAQPYLLGFGYASWVWLCAIEPSPSAVTFAIGATVVIAAMNAVLLFLHERAFRRFASLVLSFPSRGAPSSGRMLLAEGRVVTEGTVVRRRVEFIPKRETSYSTTESGQTRERTTTIVRDREHTSAEPFELAIDGADVRVRVTPRGASLALATRSWSPHASLSVYEETLAHDQHACVVARFDRAEDGTLLAAARGDESLFVWGGSRASLRRALLAARAKLLGAALLVVLPLALALYLFPFAARFHATGTVISSSGSVPVGSDCALRVIAYHYHAAPRCSVRLACGGEHLYGGFEMGQTECAFSESPLEPTAAGSDATAFDGDPAIAFSLPERTLSWSDESGASVLVRLEPASPSPWW